MGSANQTAIFLQYEEKGVREQLWRNKPENSARGVYCAVHCAALCTINWWRWCIMSV